MDIIIRSLYKNNEVFLRELISNSSDALNKVRIQRLTNDKLFQKEAGLVIEIIPDKENDTLTIRDTGVGMTKDELTRNLGTIARSGTLEFLTKAEVDDDMESLIGQFGVGFYSAFLVAEQVTVRTRSSATNAKSYEWVSKGEDGFTISEVEKEDRGTEIILKLKEEETGFLDKFKVQNIVKKYSDFVVFPISWIAEEEEEDEVDNDKSEDTSKSEAEDSSEEETSEEEEKDYQGELLNSRVAMWRKPAEEIKEEEYTEFYRHISGKWDEPFLKIHGKAENPEFYFLLYIPKSKPSNHQMEVEWGLKLYSKKVLIQDNNHDLIPEYLRFIVGLMDSEDLPLNVSREVVQNSRLTRQMKKFIHKKIIEELEKQAEEDKETYFEFFKEFNSYIKEGIAVGDKHKDRLISLLRFHTTYDHVDGRTGTVSLDDYIERMATEQKDIYFLAGGDFKTLMASPHLEYYKENDYEVLLLVDPIDNFLMMHLKDYHEKPFLLIDEDESEAEKEAEKETEKGDDKKEGEEEKPKPKTGPHAELLTKFENILKEKVKEVKVSDRLVANPARLVTPKGGMSSTYKRVLKYMDPGSGASVFNSMSTKEKILQINPNHSVILAIQQDLKHPKNRALIEQVYLNAILRDGDTPDLNLMLENIETLMADSLNVKLPKKKKKSKVKKKEKKKKTDSVNKEKKKKADKKSTDPKKSSEEKKSVEKK